MMVSKSLPGPTICLDSFTGDGASYRFHDFVKVVQAFHPGEVEQVLREADREAAQGRHAVGFVSYDAAPAMDTCLSSRRGHLPLAWFAIFRDRMEVKPEEGKGDEPFSVSGWSDTVDRCGYRDRFHTIRNFIAAGHTYQVNYTFRRRFRFEGDPLGFYRRLCRAQGAPFCAFLDTGGHIVLSASPELFFRLEGEDLELRPMKGTAGRGTNPPEDRALREGLRQSAKDRAENVMIVDLLRNDAGKVAVPGGVRVSSLFDVETLETVHQMTSTVAVRVPEGTGIAPLFAALFPCGSVTGAPKRRTMEIIADLEDTPRGLYTGAIGYVSPGPKAVFSVAIRTVVIDRETGMAEMGTGSGVTWGSDPDGEYGEAMAKTAFARNAAGDFRLIETIRHAEGGWFLLPRHLARMQRSAGWFDFPFDPQEAASFLSQAIAGKGGELKVRLLLRRDGWMEAEAHPLEAGGDAVLPVAFAAEPVDSRDPFRYHKTTVREELDAARGLRSDCADVIFLNERGEVTESSTANVVVRVGGDLVTPPLGAGLLPGTYREELLERGVLSERTISRKELEEAGDFFLINSVRKWRTVRLVP